MSNLHHLDGAYFGRVQDALNAAGIGQPTLIVDRERLNANIDTFMGHLPEGMGG